VGVGRTGRTDDAYAAFVAEHASALARVAHQLTHEPEAAADLVQDVLLQAYRRRSRVSAATSPYAYVRRMLVNAHLDSVRGRPVVRSWRPDDDARLAVAATDPGERDRVWRALGRLPARQRAVLVLRHYERCDDVEIAAVLGCRRATVRSLAARGAAALRPHLIETAEEAR
jgi:RNA polymerase sigma-70 factor (sigma-E family)